MATLSDIKNRFEQQKNALRQVAPGEQVLVAEQEQREQNQGGFWSGIGYSFEKLGLGFVQSIEGIWDFTAGGLADLFGAHDWAEQQIANDWVNYYHADEWFNPSEGWQTVGDVTGGIGTSLPALIAVAAAAGITVASGGTLSPVAAGLIGGAVAGLGAAGSATKEAYRESGELTGKEWGYGALTGATEGAMEGVTDAIGFGVGSITKNIAASTAKEGAKQVGKQIAKSAARQTLGKTIFKSFISEAFEEGVQELIDPIWKRITYDPNAKNATFQEVAYAALVGGLSGAVMGGADVSVRNSINYFKGSRINGNGGAQGVIDLAQTIADTEGINQSGNAQVDFVVNTLNELQKSLQKTNGEIKTAKQKMLVGILSSANTYAPLSIVVNRNADAIVNDAETTVKRLNDIGYKTSNGEAVTVEMLTDGVDLDKRGTKKYRRSLSEAMRTNEVLRSVAVMSAAGQLNMDAAAFQQSVLRGEQLFNQADLNHFIETATDAQKRDVGERLGISDWDVVTADELKSRLVDFSTNGGLDQYINERNEVKKLTELEISKKGLPKYVGAIKQDGAVRYKFGDASVAIVKKGDTYLVYDYANDVISKPLSKVEANRVIKEIYAASLKSEAGSEVQTTESEQQQTRSEQQTQELDDFAREHIPDYKKIVGAQQQAVRQTLRQARAAGVSEADQILYASVAARSGAIIEFARPEDLGANADAGYSLKDGKILVNREIANNPKARTAAKILLHEFTHALIHRGYTVKGKKGKKHIENKVLNDFFNVAIKGLSVEQQVEILTPYVERHGVKMQDFIDGKVDLSLDTYTELREELAAHFVERELGSSAALKRIISDKPSFKNKLLSFLKKTKKDYRSNEKLSRAANALLKKYQTFFNKYATQIRFSPTIASDLSAYKNTETDTDTRLALQESFDKLGKYTAEEIRSIEMSKLFQVARSYNDVKAFISSAQNSKIQKRLFLGKVTTSTAAKIQAETGLNVEGKSIALSSDDIRHIFRKHGTDGTELTRGQVAVTQENFENIIDTLIEPDTVTRTDENGNVGLQFQKEIDGRVTAITVVSEKRKTLTLKSAWITKEKQHISPPSNAETLNRTSETLQSMNAVPNNSIPNNEQNVNPKNKKSDKMRYALPDLEQEAVNKFGHTYKWAETGYILTDGSRLDFSGKNEGASGGYRTVDHKEISVLNAYENMVGADSLIDFMKRGNIRILPEYGGISLSVLPTKAQENALSDFISKNRGEITLDIDNANGDTVVSVEYPRGTHYSKILQDIKNYFKDGTEPVVSELSKFRYALPETDSTGRKLSAQQRRYFNDSKVVDNKGQLLAVFNGTKTEHNTESVDLGFTYRFLSESLQNKNIPNRFGFFFTDSKETAEHYSITWKTKTQSAEIGRVNEVYLNITNPLDLRELGLSSSEKAFYTLLEQSGVITERSRYKQDYKPVWRRFDKGGEALRRQIESAGYDGIIFHDWGDEAATYIAFYPEQIKLTTNQNPTQSSDIRYALDMSKRQGKTSAATSINSAKLPVLYGKVAFKAGTVNLDIGGGRFDNVTDFLATKGVKNYIYDPYNRSAEHNAAVAKATQEGQSDTVTISNVLNVIDSADGRRQVLENAVDAVKPDGTVYITVYEGDGSGVARSTGKDQFQLNRKTADYVAEVQEYFDDVTVKNKVIIAKSPKKISAAPDTRFALAETDSDTNIDPTESDNSGAIGGLTRGQRAKFVANNTKFKVYSKTEAASVIDSIIAERLTLRDGQLEGELSGKSKSEVIERLFTKLNSTSEGYQTGVALNIADYIINNAVLTDMYETFNDDSYAMGVLSTLRGYMHRVDLGGIQSEIQHKFDKNNSINLVWGAKKDGIAPDVIAQALESEGIHIEAENEADQFFEMLEIYESAKKQVNQRAEKIMLTAIGSEAEIKKLRQEIARDVLTAYDKKGSPSKYAKLVEKYTKKISDLKKDLSTAYKRNTIINRIVDGATYLREIATKRNYVGAEVFAAPELTAWLKQLAKIKYRSDLRKTGVRQILLDYGLFYNKQNTLLYDENPDLSYVDENVLDALDYIRQNALSNKPLSMEELQAAEIIIASAKHLFNTYDQVIIEGKKAKVSELAAEGNEIIKKSKNRTGKGFFNRIYGVFNKIVEPRVVIKSLENYNPNGILTRAYNEVTNGETEAGLLYIELTNDIDTFLKKNKRFKKRLASEYITVAGHKLTVGQAISLFELSKRPQAQEGLYKAGFSYIDKKGSKQSVRIKESDISALSDAFTDTDKGFIELVETFFNVSSKQVKTDADMQILGYTNTSEEFYYPIKRDSGTIVKNITDARSIMADWANVYNFSFNKDVKTGAKNKLFITDVYSVVTRHAKQLSIYARMTVPLKNFSQIYAKNIGDKTDVITIRNTLNEQVWGGTEKYLSKLFSDIQGRVTSSSFIEKMRGAYAKYQLGANLKVIVSQITSYPTAGILLDTGVMAKGFVMRTNWAAMDKYCPYARVRNYERGIVKAEGVIDKVGKVGDVLTKPIQWTDRFTIGRLWNACQLQIQKDAGLKYGTVENMQKAGVLLEEVIRLTQPNYTNTERSELMRSDSDIVRSFTMFTSVPLKQLSRLVESFGEYKALRSLIKSGDADETLAKRYKLAKKKIRRTLAAVTIANLMYVLVGQFFKFLYNNMAEDEEEGKVTAKSVFLDMLSDFGSTTIGMLPVVRDIYGYFANGYEINSFTGDMLNSIIGSAKALFELATKAGSGEEVKTQDYMLVFRNSLYSIGQVTGIPVRNINNTITGLIRRFSTSAAYSYTSLFYNPQYSTDIKAALKKGDYDLAETIMGMMLKDDRTGGLNERATKKFIELYDAGYSVLPQSIGKELTYKGETIRLTAAQQSAFKAIYSQANAQVERMVSSMEFVMLPAEKQAKAIKLLYDAYYSKARSSVLKVSNDNRIMTLDGVISPSTLATHLTAISAIESDKGKKGAVIVGSQKANVIKYVMAQRLTTAQKLLLILSLGYTIKDGDIRGISAAKAKNVVARFISNLSLTRAEKTVLAEKCGLTVRNGRIYAA